MVSKAEGQIKGDTLNWLELNFLTLQILVKFKKKKVHCCFSEDSHETLIASWVFGRWCFFFFFFNSLSSALFTGQSHLLHCVLKII